MKHTRRAILILLIVFTLLTGLCLAGIGLVLAVMFALMEGISWGMLSGLIPLAVGAALLIFSHSCPGDEK